MAGYEFEETYVQEDDESESSSKLITDGKQKLIGKVEGVLPGFRVASNSDYQLERCKKILDFFPCASKILFYVKSIFLLICGNLIDISHCGNLRM